MKTYKRRKNKNIVDENALNSAALEVIEGRLSVRRAACKYKLKPTTLYTRIVKRRRFEPVNHQTIYSIKHNSQQVFTVWQEKQLLEYLVKCNKMHYGLTFVQLQQLAYEFAKKVGCQCPRSWNDAKCGGRTWVTGFCNRNNISLKKPEVILFNETNLSEFYGTLEDLLKKYNFTADRIVNFDEMNMTFDEHDPTKNNQDHLVSVSAEKRNHVIFGGIIIGNGNIIPPIFVFPLVSHKDDFLLDAPQGSLGLTSTTDWMTSDLFLEVLKYIQKHTNCTKEKPVLLLCVSRESHISIEAMDYLLENGIIYLSVPPCTSQMLQPLHAIFGPFKAKLKIAFNNWYKNHPEEILPICKIPALTKIAYLESFTNENITSAFSKSGIQPFSKAFSVEDFPFYKLSRDVPNKDFQASTSKMILDATPIPTAQTQSTSLLTDSLAPINITSEDTLSASKTISKMPESVRHSKMIATFIKRQKSKKSGIYADSLENQDLQEYFGNRKEQNRFVKEYKKRVIKEQRQRAKDLEKSKKLSGCSKQVKKKRYRWEIDSDSTSYSSEVTEDSSTDYSEFSDDDNSINNMITPVQSEPENPKVSDSVLIKYEEDIYDDKIEQDTTMNNGILQESDRNGMESDMPSLPHNSQNDSSILNTSTNSTSRQVRSSESNNDKIKNINGTYLDPSLVTLNDFLRNHFANQLSHSINQNGLNLTLTPDQSFSLLVATELKQIPEPEKTKRKQAIVDILWKPI